MGPPENALHTSREKSSHLFNTHVPHSGYSLTMRQYRLHRTSSRRTEAHLQESTTNQLVLRGRHDLLSKPLISVTNYDFLRAEEHTSELQSRGHLVCRLLLE